ncbi:respiratory nitrate reductase subunit gamma [Desulfoscipio geothermicus]|uniref:Nitrate reductase gamma subunit n=1 Tax=Desulfoscipio geothermicus DSM 3669 TaxID=1121426 RepID=A0A1I6CYT8_9FIRM|nr:respiratory nitrate reductase subunit gamma [Desulfoscipio geothermicus]SFQ98404.1 Nitrate reductase gamma subunit [Desulfoscipio geothermicus DSM 3669]
MKLLIGQILPYITVTLFTLGILYRLGRWAGARIIHNITLSPWLDTNGQVAVRIGSEAFLFRNLFKFDIGLWAGAFLMHFALLNILGGHIVGFGLLGEQFALIPGLGISPELSKEMSDLLGTVFGILLFVALLYLLYRRVAMEKVKLVTKTSDNLWLIYLLVLVGVGNIMRLFHPFHVEYELVRDYIVALALFQPVVNMELLNNGFFLVHYLLVQILLIVFPFSKLMHLFGMFAERWIVNRVYKDPAPGLPNVDVAAARKAGLGLPSGDAVEGGM